MFLVVDIGNTRTKYALHNGQHLLEPIVLEHNDLSHVIKEIKGIDISHGIVSSVGKEHLKNEWQAKFKNIHWLELMQNTPVPFINKYESPETLGLDRIALVAAAVDKFESKNALIIDAGTCVTYDFVTEEKEYLGGAISPGLLMRLQAMHKFTARLPEVTLEENVALIGKTTAQSMQSGALYGLAGELNDLIRTYQEQFDNLHIVITGGDAKSLVPLIKSNIFARPNFLLEGLHVILAYNTP